MADAPRKRKKVLTDPPPAPAARKHLEGWRYYLIYLPAIFVAGWCALLFVAAVDRLIYGDVDDEVAP